MRKLKITNKDEHEGFTQQDLVVSWRAMCSRMPERMQALSQRMKEYHAYYFRVSSNLSTCW